LEGGPPDRFEAEPPERLDLPPDGFEADGLPRLVSRLVLRLGLRWVSRFLG